MLLGGFLNIDSGNDLEDHPYSDGEQLLGEKPRSDTGVLRAGPTPPGGQRESGSEYKPNISGL
jgi:hypothetical protein